MTSRYTFTAEDLNGFSATTSEIECVSWPEISETFYHFLLGAGFVLERQDLSDLFDERQFSTQAEEVL